MYDPSQGIDYPLDWVMQKVGDIWKGTNATDPAGYKGNRVPQLTQDKIKYACAAYTDNRLYVGLPTNQGTSTAIGNSSNVILVIDFRYKQCWINKYPFSFNNIFWDQFKNRLYVITANGNVVTLENGLVDITDVAGGSGTPAVSVAWNFKTRSWPAPTEILMENLAIQYRG